MNDTLAHEILQEIKAVNLRLDGMEKDIHTLKVDVRELKNNMRKVLKCVDHENADFNPVAVLAEKKR